MPLSEYSGGGANCINQKLNTMKKLLLTISLVLFATPIWAQVDKEADQKRYGKGQMPFNEKGEVVFSRVVHEEGHDKKALYNATKLCITNIFNSAKDVIQLDDPDQGIIIVKGYSVIPTRAAMGMIVDANIYYTLDIRCRDGRYKIDIRQIKGHSPAGMTNGVYLPATDTPAELLTYDLCFKQNGKMKAIEGFYRRAIIDCCNPLLDQIQKDVHNNLIANPDNDTEDW